MIDIICFLVIAGLITLAVIALKGDDNDNDGFM